MSTMKVLVIGSGGREHAIAWKLAQSERVERVYVAPGNGGTALEVKCRNLPVPGSDPASPEAQEFLADFARKESIACTVVGPEAPLAEGLADTFTKAGLAVVGPRKDGARLESSKAFAKDFMAKYGVRTARSNTATTVDEALALERHRPADDISLLVVNIVAASRLPDRERVRRMCVNFPIPDR